MSIARKSLISLAVFSGLALSSTSGFAQNKGNAGDDSLPKRFAELCDTDKDGMVSKDEMMKRVQMAWDKADVNKKGMLDRAATAKFIKEFYLTN